MVSLMDRKKLVEATSMKYEVCNFIYSWTSITHNVSTPVEFLKKSIRLLKEKYSETEVVRLFDEFVSKLTGLA